MQPTFTGLVTNETGTTVAAEIHVIGLPPHVKLTLMMTMNDSTEISVLSVMGASNVSVIETAYSQVSQIDVSQDTVVWFRSHLSA